MGIEEFILQRVKEDVIETTTNKNKLDFTKKLLTQTDFTFERIADMVDLPVSFVAEVKASLGKSN